MVDGPFGQWKDDSTGSFYQFTNVDVDITGCEVAAVPEPLSLLGLGLAGAVVRRRLQRR